MTTKKRKTKDVPPASEEPEDNFEVLKIEFPEELFATAAILLAEVEQDGTVCGWNMGVFYTDGLIEGGWRPGPDGHLFTERQAAISHSVNCLVEAFTKRSGTGEQADRASAIVTVLREWHAAHGGPAVDAARVAIHEQVHADGLEQVDEADPKPNATESEVDRVDEDDETTGVVVGAVKVAEIEWHPNNPRQAFDEAELRPLGASMQRVQLLQPIIVRPHPDAQSKYLWQGLAGERRFRAAQLVGMEEITASVRYVDDATALDIVVSENFDRVELTPIEQARAVKALCDSGRTQKEVAARYGHKQSWVANLLRLLELPESVQAAVNSGELDQVRARELVANKHVPQLIDAVLEEMRSDIKEDGWRAVRWRDRETFKEMVADVIGSQTGYLSPQDIEKLTPAEREQLQVVEVSRYDELAEATVQDHVALNVDAYDAWQEAKSPPRKHSEESPTKAPNEAAKEPTAAELRKKKAEQAKQLAHRIKDWRRRWQRFILARVYCESYEDEAIANVSEWHMQALLYFLAEQGGHHSRSLLEQALRDMGQKVPSGWENLGWRVVAAAKNVDWLGVLFLRRAFWPAHDARKIDPSNKIGLAEITYDTVDALAAAAGFDAAQAWDLIQAPAKAGDDNADFRDRFAEFLNLHQKDQLIAQATEWGLDVSAAKNKAAIVELILAHDDSLPLPACLAPPAKTKAKAKGKRKAKRKVA